MRRADRLFRLVQILRRGRVITARSLAEELEVSERTVYRDIADLQGSGVPVEGEAGVGYVMRSGYDLPPLMFELEEIEALVLGMRMVAAWADPALQRAAEDVLSKVETVVPEAARKALADTAIDAFAGYNTPVITIDVADIRRALRIHRKLRISYCDAKGDDTIRVVWPLGIVVYRSVWLMPAWCELRQDFRIFRLDRLGTLTIDEPFTPTPDRSLDVYLERMRTCSPLSRPGEIEAA